MMTRSIHEPCRQAASTPSGTARTTEITMARRVRATVGPTRWEMRVVTGSPEYIDVPRSPRSTLPSQMPT